MVNPMENPNEKIKLTPTEIAQQIVNEQKISDDTFALLECLKQETTESYKPLIEFISALSDSCTEQEFKAYMAEILETAL